MAAQPLAIHEPETKHLGGNSVYVRPVCCARKGTRRKVEQFTGVVPDYRDLRKQVGQQSTDGCTVGLGKAAVPM
jgi:hypothetical protein